MAAQQDVLDRPDVAARVAPDRTSLMARAGFVMATVAAAGMALWLAVMSIRYAGAWGDWRNVSTDGLAVRLWGIDFLVGIASFLLLLAARRAIARSHGRLGGRRLVRMGLWISALGAAATLAAIAPVVDGGL